jgi:hypothetical protein
LKFAVSIVLLVPGFIDYLIAVNRSNRSLADAEFTETTNRSSQLGGYSLAFWSIFFCAAYLVYQVCRIIAWVFPQAFLALHRGLFGQVSKSAELAVDYLLDVHAYSSLALWFICLAASWYALIQPDQYVDQVNGCFSQSRVVTAGMAMDDSKSNLVIYDGKFVTFWAEIAVANNCRAFPSNVISRSHQIHPHGV